MNRSNFLRLFSLTSLLILCYSQIVINGQNNTQQGKRIALVIGNGNYLSSSLANPENDARSMRDALKNVGFFVIEYYNLNQNQIKKAIDDFGAKLKGYDVGLFYYAGHGIQSKGYNYLIPVDAQLQSEQQIEYDCVQADRILALMEASGTKVNIIILDACRNNPFERSWTRTETGKGLAFMNAPSGTLIAYATSPGSTASDGSGKNGLYTSAILESIKIPNITIIQMFQNVRNIVSQKSSKQQVPWESTSLIGDFYFLRTSLPNNEVSFDTTTKIYQEESKIDVYFRKNITINLGRDFHFVPYISPNIFNGSSLILDYSWTKSSILLNNLTFAFNTGETGYLTDWRFYIYQLGYLKGIYFERNKFHFELNAGINLGYYYITAPNQTSAPLPNTSSSPNIGFPYSLNVYYSSNIKIVIGIFLYGNQNLYSKTVNDYKLSNSYLSSGLKIGYRF